MKKINLETVETILTEDELKNVLGGSGTTCSGGIACSGSCSDPQDKCQRGATQNCGCYGKIHF